MLLLWLGIYIQIRLQFLWSHCRKTCPEGIVFKARLFGHGFIFIHAVRFLNRSHRTCFELLYHVGLLDIEISVFVFLPHVFFG